MPLFKRPAATEGSAVPAIVIGIFVAFGGILFGYDTGTIGGILAMDYWKSEFSTGYINAKGEPDITSSQNSEIVSILSAGTFFGALTAAPLGDNLGRRMGLIVSTGVFCVGVAFQTAATAIPLFVAGRFFAGYGVGLISALIPLYQSETSPKWIRGAIVGCYQLAITIGLLLAAIVDNATKNRKDSGSYRIPIAVQFAWAIILVGGLIFLPETPRYLIKRDDHAAASLALARLRRLPPSHPAISDELAEIHANHTYEMSLGQATYIDCCRGNLGVRLATGCALQALQQLTGVNFIFYYGTSFFKNAGFDNPFTITMITSCINVVTTLPGLWMIESWGRRKLLFMGACGMAFCQFVVAITGTVAKTSDRPSQKAMISFVCFYIFFFASTWGPAAWVVTGEIFPLKVRAKSLSMTTASNWLLNWAIAYSTPYMVDSGPGNANMGAKVFFVWGTCCFLCILFVWGFIYETKGLSLEEVDELYEKVDRAWKSPGFVPETRFVDEVEGRAKDSQTVHVAHVDEKAEA